MSPCPRDFPVVFPAQAGPIWCHVGSGRYPRGLTRANKGNGCIMVDPFHLPDKGKAGTPWRIMHLLSLADKIPLWEGERYQCGVKLIECQDVHWP